MPDYSIPFFSGEQVTTIVNGNYNPIFLDVQTPVEYAERHIPNSLNIDYYTMSEREIHSKLPDKERLILVYCRSGSRSKPVVRKLRNMNYRAVDIGGLDDWQGNLEGTMA